ncbi:MAG: hypothetical protein ABSC11_08860 [Smithella sp.]
MGRYISLSFFIFLFLSFFVYAQNDSGLLNIDAEGQAVIKQNDVARARQEAIREALGNAVQTAAAQLLSVGVKDERFRPVKSAVIEEPDKFISVYKISAERKETLRYIVNVNVTVVLADLRNDLDNKGFFQTLRTEGKNDLTVFLNVRGLKNYADYSRLKEFLQSRTSVKSIYPCRFAWQQAQFEVTLFGNTQSLADELIKKGWCLLPDIKQVDKNHMEIKCMYKEEKS